MSAGNLYQCKSCGKERFRAFGRGSELTKKETRCCGQQMAHMTTETPGREEGERLREQAVKESVPTPHVAAFYRRAQDENPLLPDPVALWNQAGKPTSPGSYPCQGGTIIVHNGPADPIFFIGPLEAKMIVLGFRKATYPVQISFAPKPGE